MPFTTLWGANAVVDSWAGFPTERKDLLEALHSVPNVIILSGDRHEFAAIEYNHETGHTIREFSTRSSAISFVHASVLTRLAAL